MEKRYKLIFDEVIIKQFKKAATNIQVKEILKKMFDRLEFVGSAAGKMIDSQLHVYEVKNKNPPIRLYFKYNDETEEIYVFEFEMKTSEKKQKKTIQKIRHKVIDLES